MAQTGEYGLRNHGREENCSFSLMSPQFVEVESINIGREAVTRDFPGMSMDGGVTNRVSASKYSVFNLRSCGTYPIMPGTIFKNRVVPNVATSFQSIFWVRGLWSLSNSHLCQCISLWKLQMMAGPKCGNCHLGAHPRIVSGPLENQWATGLRETIFQISLPSWLIEMENTQRNQNTLSARVRRPLQLETVDSS